MSHARILVTGGTGFIGSAVVKALLRANCSIRVFDNNSRGSPRRLADVAKDIEIIAGDIRDSSAVEAAARGMDEIYHLAFINGTEYFYNAPELVLDVGVRGMLNVIDACRKQNIGRLVLASSSEVYQTPPKIPTDESAPLVVPDVQNPRYSYGAGKLISEVMAVNFGRKYFERVLIFRPHNVYGPDMGFEHVIPQFALRLQAIAKVQPVGRLRFEIQGSGAETRSFCYIDDLVAGVMAMRESGNHLGVYHIGSTEEITIADLALRVATHAGREITLVPSSRRLGGTLRRCPDISKLARLGYSPRVRLNEGLPPTLDWYRCNSELAPKA